MADELQGKRIAILAATGVEQVELEQPRDAVQSAGAQTDVVSIEEGEIQAMSHDIDKGDKIAVDRLVSEASPDDYDALILPGGTMNPTICARTSTRRGSYRTSSGPVSRSA